MARGPIFKGHHPAAVGPWQKAASTTCPHQRNGLVLLVWGFILAVAGQGGPKLCRGSPGQQCCVGTELGWALQSAAHFLTLLLGGFDLSRDRDISCPQLQEWRQGFSPFPPPSMNNPHSGCRGPPQPICPQGSCPWVSAQPQREVLYSTAPKDC